MSRRDIAIFPARALLDDRLTRADLLVLHCVGTHADFRTGSSVVSYPTLSKITEYSAQTCVVSVKRLTECGYLRVRRRARPDGGQVSNEYLVCLDPPDWHAPDTDLLDSPQSSVVDSPSKPDAPDQFTGGSKAPTPGQVYSKSSSKHHQETTGDSPKANGKKRETWLTPYRDAWFARFGGEPDYGIFARYLKPLDAQHGPAVVAPALTAFLDKTEAQYVSLPRFAATFGVWAGSNPDKPLDTTGLGDEPGWDTYSL